MNSQKQKMQCPTMSIDLPEKRKKLSHYYKQYMYHNKLINTIITLIRHRNVAMSFLENDMHSTPLPLLKSDQIDFLVPKDA